MTMRINWALAILTVSLLVLPSLPKAAPPDTYTGKAQVASQSEQERNQAVQTALGQVVVDIAGDPDVLKRKDVAQALGKAAGYMVQYSYQQDSTVGDNGESGLLLVVAFDRAAVDSMLGRLGLVSQTDYGPDPSGAAQSARVWISGINSIADYARVMQYLEHNNMVESVRLKEVRGDGLSVELSLEGDLRHFLDAVQMENKLHVISEQPPVAGIDATLSAH